MIKEFISSASDVFQRAVNVLTSTPPMTSAVYKSEYNSKMVSQIGTLWVEAYPTGKTGNSYKIAERSIESTLLIIAGHKNKESHRSIRMDENNDPIMYTKEQVEVEFKKFEERMDTVCGRPRARHGINYSKKSNANMAMPAENFGPAIW